MITVCDVPHVLEFFEQVTDYQLMSKVRLPVATLVSMPIRNRIACRPENAISVNAIYQLDTVEFFHMIMREIRPLSSNNSMRRWRNMSTSEFQLSAAVRSQIQEVLRCIVLVQSQIHDCF